MSCSSPAAVQPSPRLHQASTLAISCRPGATVIAKIPAGRRDFDLRSSPSGLPAGSATERSVSSQCCSAAGGHVVGRTAGQRAGVPGRGGGLAVLHAAASSTASRQSNAAHPFLNITPRSPTRWRGFHRALPSAAASRGRAPAFAGGSTNPPPGDVTTASTSAVEGIASSKDALDVGRLDELGQRDLEVLASLAEAVGAAPAYGPRDAG